MKLTAFALLTTTVAAIAADTSLDDAPQPPQAKSSAETKATDDITPPGLIKLSKTNDIWLDTKRKAVVVDGQVCLREGLLEMFACPKGTKEHESVVSLNCQADEVHAGLLAAGAKPGS